MSRSNDGSSSPTPRSFFIVLRMLCSILPPPFQLFYDLDVVGVTGVRGAILVLLALGRHLARDDSTSAGPVVVLLVVGLELGITPGLLDFGIDRDFGARIGTHNRCLLCRCCSYGVGLAGA